MKRPWILSFCIAAACAPAQPSTPPSQPVPKPNMDPGSLDRPGIAVRPDSIAQDTSLRAPGKTPAEADSEPPVAPADAYQRGWMPLRETGVAAFVRAHPRFDGRGVLIAILDSGIDAGVPGLVTTSTGARKILDLRDFSGEGAIALTPVTVQGDAVTVGGRRLTGLGRITAMNAGARVYAGVLRERVLGSAPAADVNGNGTDTDVIPLVVVRARDGWVVFADTDGDGSLDNERPVHDYLVAQETFGWHSGGKRSLLTVAANVAAGDASSPPSLDLFFDTSAHGTHVAGIAAANDMYGVAGFDGVAPGAQLLGCKIANNAFGGISTTGSMLRALDYAIRLAAARQLPLVVNMSFGVGNEAEGTARIDAIIDSVLAVHPEIVFTVSAGNDGPGLSSIGFPGSASRIISVGATIPAVFTPDDASGRGREPVAYFSSRGGELARPDIMTPGIAYSTVPGWDAGGEQKTGTSMASPHAAGLAALLQSSIAAGARRPDAATIRQALMVTARPIDGASYLDQGAGMPDVGRAYRWLQRARPAAVVGVTAPGGRGTASYQIVSRGTAPDTVRTFTLRATRADTFRLRSSVAWLHTPARTITSAAGAGSARVTYDARRMQQPGVYTGVVTGWTRDTLAGPAFRLLNTVVVGYPAGTAVSTHAVLPPASIRRVFFQADSERPFEVRVTSDVEATTAYLHEPNGMPYRDGNGASAGSGEAAALYEIGARDVVAGMYEVVVAAPPASGSNAQIEITHAPVRLRVARERAGIVATVVNTGDSALDARVAVVIAGASRSQVIVARGSEQQRISFTLPAWARGAVVEISMDRAQWPRFTDFGMTVLDSSGAQIAQEPLNYAIGRLQVPLADGHRSIPAALLLNPGFADPDSNEGWTANVSIRLYGDSAVTASSPAGAVPVDLHLAARASGSVTFSLPPLPWTFGDGFVPMGAVVTLVGGRVWTREAAFPPAAPSVMR